jgi:hypothetical protein
MKSQTWLIAAGLVLTAFVSITPSYGSTLNGIDKLCEGPAERKALDMVNANIVDPENGPLAVIGFEPEIFGKSYIVTIDGGGQYRVITKLSTLIKHIGDETVEMVCTAISAEPL